MLNGALKYGLSHMNGSSNPTKSDYSLSKISLKNPGYFEPIFDTLFFFDTRFLNLNF
jgi:hypothetical protein